MRFIYLFFVGLNFLVLSVYSKNNHIYLGINKCHINERDFNTYNLKERNNNNPRISITSLVRIRNKRINLAITEAKLKAKRKLIRLLKKEHFDNPKIERVSDYSFNTILRGAMVTKICIQNGEFLKLNLEVNDKSITNINKNYIFLIK